jgi:hypothetical protein
MKFLIALILTLLIPNLALAKTNSLCKADEQTFFSCTANKGKLISVCGSKDLSETNGYLQYRFGKLNKKPELTFPSSYQHPKNNFALANVGSAKSSAYNFRFKTSSFNYVVYVSTHAFGTPPYASAGVTSKKDNESIHYTTCKKQILQRNFPLLQFIGLPTVNRDDFTFEP